MRQIRNIKNRLAALALLLFVGVATALAQAPTVKHIVERGETLETIAKKYGVTKEEIINLNPDAAQFVYVGMELTVPQKANTTAAAKEGKTQQPEAVENRTTSGYKSITNTSTTSRNLDDFSHYILNYAASFESADCGLYSFGGQGFSNSGWGAYFTIGANYGLIDSDYAGVAFKVGPTYGYAISDNVFLAVPLTFTGYYMGQGKETKHVEKINQIGVAAGKKFSYDTEVTKDNKFYAGVDLMPHIGVKLNKIVLHAGLDFSWTKDTDILVGFVAGLGLKI